jgi:Restriction endonuclease
MLAWIIKKNEAVGQWELWNRVNELYERVLGEVTGEANITFAMVRDLCFITQHKKITPLKLYQRADKAERYSEFNETKESVVRSYLAATGKQPKKDTRRSFTKEDLLVAALRQDGKCYFCRAEFDNLCLPVGDHLLAYSLGGPTIAENCVASCVRCNQDKGSMTVFEYGRKCGMRDARGRKL